MRTLITIFLFSISNLLLSQAIPTEIKKTVGFIYAKDKFGKVKPQGTGFFVSVSDSINGQPRSAFYFVTAKHVLKQNKTFRDTILIRLNTKDSLSEYGRLELHPNGVNKNIFIHADKTVDIAVIPIGPDPTKFDYLTLPSTFLTNKKNFKDLNIREGSDVFFTGMFTPFIGDKRIYPIVRFGRVALLTEEKIPWDNEMTSLYLMETSSYGGNSGSPVFFYLGADRGNGGLFVGNPELKLAGIMKGYFGESSPIKIIETQKIPVSDRNLGIAAVVPSYFLEEILFGTELKNIRGF
ncbi:S1 family peptidase [Hwangdonia lutea]|uniref:Serine protease n=1 Tax=Hwangdonia lutea TaxID=3075823 RepID=A0AA97EK15_9FLAO|nr:serine protease [Hwangdonia sp. SCSIO 19198]WOD42517.1 serine protease [Hwangdonia sp. SCSIO 19198]